MKRVANGEPFLWIELSTFISSFQVKSIVIILGIPQTFPGELNNIIADSVHLLVGKGHGS